MEQMIVTIKNGNLEIEIEGVKGSRCFGLTQAIEELLGDIDQRVVKNDFFLSEAIKQNSILRHGFKGPNG
jgi:hypothetical protein